MQRNRQTDGWTCGQENETSVEKKKLKENDNK